MNPPFHNRRTMSSTPIVIVPGWRNSGPGHWQSLWEECLPGAHRVTQGDWQFPRRQAWVDRLTEAILASEPLGRSQPMLDEDEVI